MRIVIIHGICALVALIARTVVGITEYAWLQVREFVEFAMSVIARPLSWNPRPLNAGDAFHDPCAGYETPPEHATAYERGMRLMAAARGI